jgi:PEP-CTERM motif
VEEIMRRLAVILSLLTLLLPGAAWADGIQLTNSSGMVIFNTANGVTTMSTTGSELKSYGNVQAAKGHSLGTVNFSTGAFLGSSIWSSGSFSSTGSTFDVVGVGPWVKQLTGQSKNPVTLFSGGFTGPINWTLDSQNHTQYIFTLSGAISGMYYTGRTVTGTTSQTIYMYTDQEPFDHKGGIHLGQSSLATPEPGTFGLLGTGLIMLAGGLRRKIMAGLSS